MPAKRPFFERLRGGFSYAFGGMLSDIGSWLLIGIVIAGVISFFVPAGFFEQHKTSGFISLLMMLGIGIPLYICATASTPIAAALVMKGLSPGAALVLLLAGPATNAATLTVVAKFMGKKVAVLYVTAISLCSLLLGWAVDQVYRISGMSTHHWTHTGGEHGLGPISIIMSVVLILLIVRNYVPKLRATEGSCGCEGNPAPPVLAE